MADDNVTLAPAAEAKNAIYKAPVHVMKYVRDEEHAAAASAIDTAAKALDAARPHDNNAAGLKSVAVISRSTDDARRLHAAYTGAPAPGTDRIIWDSPLTPGVSPDGPPPRARRARQGRARV